MRIGSKSMRIVLILSLLALLGLAGVEHLHDVRALDRADRPRFAVEAGHGRRFAVYVES